MTYLLRLRLGLFGHSDEQLIHDPENWVQFDDYINYLEFVPALLEMTLEH
jgi:hypothetical protein